MITIAATALLLSPFIVQADPDTDLLKLQTVAESNALELGNAVADDHWTRVEFSKVYDDPIVVIDPSNDNASNSYTVGIRNVDAQGFEINLQHCNNATDIPLQETVNFSVIENGQLPTAPEDPVTKQRFAWGECGTSRSS
jgi:hypothetical protein